jgi:hypothetical protein
MNEPRVVGGITADAGEACGLELLAYQTGDIRLALTSPDQEGVMVKVYFLLPAHNVSELAAQFARVFNLAIRAGIVFEEECK